VSGFHGPFPVEGLHGVLEGLIAVHQGHRVRPHGWALHGRGTRGRGLLGVNVTIFNFFVTESSTCKF
jgi:hypothetical protein